jgi:ADP-ribose pyrophosphatase YjhB (NUDIX family)
MKNISYINCINCGLSGHTSKTCNYPITSYGIILYKIDDVGELGYLMIQKKDSMAYVDFIRGKYVPNDLTYLYTMFNNMTKTEHEKIRSTPFEILWRDLWNNSYKLISNRDYIVAYQQFEFMKNGFKLRLLNGEKEIIKLDILLDKSQPTYAESEWEFPKGRRFANEGDLQCAIREFYEETLVNTCDILIVNNKPYVEIYTGTNNIRYRNVYFLAKYSGDMNNVISVDETNHKQIQEVKDIRWYSLDECVKKMRHIYKERIGIIKRIHKLVMNNMDVKVKGEEDD